MHDFIVIMVESNRHGCNCIFLSVFKFSWPERRLICCLRHGTRTFPLAIWSLCHWKQVVLVKFFCLPTFLSVQHSFWPIILPGWARDRWSQVNNIYPLPVLFINHVGSLLSFGYVSVHTSSASVHFCVLRGLFPMSNFLARSSIFNRVLTPRFAVSRIFVAFKSLIPGKFVSPLSIISVQVFKRRPILRRNMPSFHVLSQPEVFVSRIIKYMLKGRSSWVVPEVAVILGIRELLAANFVCQDFLWSLVRPTALGV